MTRRGATGELTVSETGLRNYLARPLRALNARLRAWCLERELRELRFASLPVIDECESNDALAPESVAQKAKVATGAGVNIYGYLQGEFGLGQSARMYASALLQAGYPVSLSDAGIEIPHSRGDLTLDHHLSDVSPYPVNLAFVNPDHFQELVPKLRPNSYNIGFWFWELEEIPADWQRSLEQVDEIWVATEFVERAFRRATDKPVVRIPHPVASRPKYHPLRASFDLDEKAFVFLCSFDFNSSVYRKNPYAVVDAFKLAFRKRHDNVQLMLKSSNGFRHPDLLRKLRKYAAGDRRIVFRDHVLALPHVLALQETADSYVSLHRAEGLGLGMAESMAQGKPVIATAWSGNLDFMTSGNSCLVPCQLVPVQPGEYLHVEGARWAQADIDSAATWMRQLVEDPGMASAVGISARQTVTQSMSSVAAASAMIERLNIIWNKKVCA